MPIEIDVPPDPGRMLRVTRTVQRRATLRAQLFGAAVVVLSVVLLAVRGWEPMAIGGLGGGLALIGAPLLLARRTKEQLANGAWHYSIDERGVVARSATITNSLSWDAFVRAQVTPSDVLLFVATRSLLVIPRASLHPAAEAELMRLLTARGLLTPAAR